MSEVLCPGCTRMVFTYQGRCTECQTVAVTIERPVLEYCRAARCNQLLKATQVVCHSCGVNQATGEAAILTTLSPKHRERATTWGCVPGLDRCLVEYKEKWFFIKNLTPDDIAECVWLVRGANMETVELNKRNREAARLVSRTNAAGKVVMVPGGNPKLKSGTQEVRVILTDYVSLEGAFRKIVIQEKFEWGKKNKRARDDDESKTIREFLRGVWLVFSGVEADEKQINRVENETKWKEQIGGVGVKNFRWCKMAFQASHAHMVGVLGTYRTLHPTIPFSTREEKVSLFKSLGWLIPAPSDGSAVNVATE